MILVVRGDYIEIQLDRRKPRRTPPIDTTDIDDPDAQLLALDDHGPADEDDLVKPKMSSWPATSATIVANSTLKKMVNNHPYRRVL